MEMEEEDLVCLFDMLNPNMNFNLVDKAYNEDTNRDAAVQYIETLS